MNERLRKTSGKVRDKSRVRRTKLDMNTQVWQKCPHKEMTEVCIFRKRRKCLSDYENLIEISGTCGASNSDKIDKTRMAHGRVHTYAKAKPFLLIQSGLNQIYARVDTVNENDEECPMSRS